MEDKDIWIGIGGVLLLVAMLTGLPYGTYRYGRFVERRALTQYFTQATIDTYEDGYGDGFKLGSALQKKACESQEELEDGRY